MADLPTTLAETTKGLATDFIKQVTEAIRKGMGGRASDAVKMSEAEELAAWMRETAPPEKVAQMIAEGADDETILQTARKYRYHLGKAAGQGDPEKECAYHESMAKKAAAFLAQNASAIPTESQAI